MTALCSTGRGLMKRFESGAELAKDMGISEDKLKSVFDEYNQVAHGKKEDPFGKKFFSSGDWKMNDFFHVAVSPSLQVWYIVHSIADTVRLRSGWSLFSTIPWEV